MDLKPGDSVVVLVSGVVTRATETEPIAAPHVTYYRIESLVAPLALAQDAAGERGASEVMVCTDMRFGDRDVPVMKAELHAHLSESQVRAVESAGFPETVHGLLAALHLPPVYGCPN